jgi:peptidoglycan hydrolase-like protein with peptidoglycan-binding domain
MEKLDRKIKALLILSFSYFIISTVPLEAQDIFTRTLEVTNPRMQGVDVRVLQHRLMDLGYTELGEVDGYYGPNTQAAVDRFRYRNRIEEGDLFNPGLVEHLFSDEAVAGFTNETNFPIIIALDGQVLGGYNGDWIKHPDLFNWFDPSSTRLFQNYVEGINRGQIPLGIYSQIYSATGPELPYILWRLTRLRSRTDANSELKGWFFTSNHDPKINDILVDLLREEELLVENFVNDWKEENQFSIETRSITSYGFDLNQDGKKDFLVNAFGSSEPMHNGPWFVQHFSIFYCLLSQSNGEYLAIKIVEYKNNDVNDHSHDMDLDFEAVLDSNGDGKFEICYRWAVWDTFGIQLVSISEENEVDYLLGR